MLASNLLHSNQVPMFLGERLTMKCNLKAQNSAPNWAVKRAPTLAMASPSSWPVLVPSALSGSGAAYLGLWASWRNYGAA